MPADLPVNVFWGRPFPADWLDPDQPGREESVHPAKTWVIAGPQARQGADIALRVDQSVEAGEFGGVDGLSAQARLAGKNLGDLVFAFLRFKRAGAENDHAARRDEFDGMTSAAGVAGRPVPRDRIPA